MRKLLSILLVAVMLSGMCMFGGCNKYGRFYTIEQAYRKKIISKENLESIANYRNSGNHNVDVLDYQKQEEIKKVWAEKNNTTAANVEIFCYYGTYDNCVVIMIRDNSENYTEQYIPTSIEIDGIVFEFGHPRQINQLVIYKN